MGAGSVDRVFKVDGVVQPERVNELILEFIWVNEDVGREQVAQAKDACLWWLG